MAIEIGDALLRVGIDIKDFQAGMTQLGNKVKSAIGGIKNDLKLLTTSMSDMSEDQKKQLRDLQNEWRTYGTIIAGVGTAALKIGRAHV